MHLSPHPEKKNADCSVTLPNCTQQSYLYIAVTYQQLNTKRPKTKRPIKTKRPCEKAKFAAI